MNADSTVAVPSGLVAEKPQLRVLLVTTEEIIVRGVLTVAWGKTLPNCADFDVVILDLVSLHKRMTTRSPATVVRPNDDEIGKLLWSQGAVICITPPVRELGAQAGAKGQSPFWWSPIPLVNVLEEGQTRKIKRDALKRYFEIGVGTWRSYPRLSKEALTLKPGGSVHFEVESWVASRYNAPIAAFVQMKHYPPLFLSASQVKASGPVLVLPEADLLSIPDAIRILLRDVLGLAPITQAPDWASKFQVPGEQAVQGEIGNLSARKLEIEKEILRSDDRLRDLVKAKRLLYEDGDELEQAVWEALEQLGAQVNPSSNPNREDRWVATKSGEKIALEVKGHLGGMSTADARQADDWTSELMIETGDSFKGVLFGNPFRGQHPEGRPEAWPPDVVRFAVKRKLALATTTQLFYALCRVNEGKMKPDEFFNRIVSTDGPVVP